MKDRATCLNHITRMKVFAELGKSQSFRVNFAKHGQSAKLNIYTEATARISFHDKCDRIQFMCSISMYLETHPNLLSVQL